MTTSTQDSGAPQEQPYDGHGILAALLDAVMKPGTAPIIRVITHVAFVSLLLLLLALLVFLPRDTTVYIHVAALFALTAGLYASIVWFLSTGIADPPPESSDDEEEEEEEEEEEAEGEDVNKEKNDKDRRDMDKKKKD